jgi:hypothetical protein
MKKITVFILLLFAVSAVFAVHEDAGSTGFAFARLLFSPRASAMGSAYAGVANDAEAVFFNPAGLFQINHTQIEAVYMNYLEGINCGSVIYARPVNNRATYAVYSRFLSTSETRTLSDAQGNYLGTDGSFGFSDLETGAAYSYHISQTLNLGATGKVLYESIDGKSAVMLAIDLGIYHITENENLHVGIALRNLGTQLSSFTESGYEENLPALADLGFGFQIFEPLLLSADLYKLFKGDYYSRFGSEITPHQNLKIRIGYKSDGGDWKTGGDGEALAGLTAGFGVLWQQYELNYAFASYGNLGIVNQIGIKYKFEGN